MNRYGTIGDVTKWAEKCLPGEESRARSVIVTCRRSGMFTKGGRGKNAPFMKLVDFPVAILAVMHPGHVTKVAEAVQSYWALGLSMIEVDDPSRAQDVQILPTEWNQGFWGDYVDRYGLGFGKGDSVERYNLIGALTVLFSNFAPHHDFYGRSKITIETAGDKVSVIISLEAGPSHTESGWRAEGPEHSTIRLIFGDRRVYEGRALKTSRSLHAEALNELAKMTPNFSKGRADG